MMPSLANMSRLRGSMPFWLITTKDSPGWQTRRLKSITCRTCWMVVGVFNQIGGARM